MEQTFSKLARHFARVAHTLSNKLDDLKEYPRLLL